MAKKMTEVFVKNIRKKINRAEQSSLPDGNGGEMVETIIEIDEAADAYQAAKKKRIDKQIELKEVELNKYDELDKVLEENKDRLGAGQAYTYTNAGGKRVTVKRGKPKITIKAAKAEKTKVSIDTTPESNEINPDGGGELPSLE